jgi:RND family efflux transporter MFP subunit
MKQSTIVSGVIAALYAVVMPSAMAQAPNEASAVVEVAQAQISRIAPKRWVPGGVVSRNDARLATSAAGRLVFVAEVGTQVRAGERVAKLEDDALKLRAEETKAEIARIDAQRTATERQLQRIEQLANNSISQTQLDEVRSQLAMLTAQLQQVQVRHRAALHELSQTELRAPFSGIVTERLAQRGEYVATGAAIAHLVDTVQLEVRAQAPLNLASFVSADMLLPIKVGTEQMTAKVRTVVPVGEERSRQFELRLVLANNALRVGTPIQVGLPEREASDSLVVPRDAIAIRQDGSFLMRVRADSTAERVAVTTRVTDGDMVTVEGNLAAGDRVVVRGVERLQDGQKVTVLTRAAAVPKRPAGEST